MRSEKPVIIYYNCLQNQDMLGLSDLFVSSSSSSSLFFVGWLV